MIFIVISVSTVIREKITTSLELEGVNVVALSSLGELKFALQSKSVSGILLDLFTSTKASAQEKQDTNDLIQLYPHARFKFSGDKMSIIGKENTLDSFVDVCRKFKARSIRKNQRRIRHIAFHLSSDGNFEKAEKTVSINFSDGGCFVFSANDWQVGDRVWLRFDDNNVEAQGIVRFHEPWGNRNSIPGIGVQFDIMPPAEN